MLINIKKTIVACLLTLVTVFTLLMLYIIASGDRSIFNAIAATPRGNQTVSRTQPVNKTCAMAAADIRMFADDYQKGVSLQDELQKYGNHDFRRSMIKQVYRMSDQGGAPDDIENAAIEQCSAETN
ncbi:hypothetical protein [Burkholderia gladioli]|uniref:hypothetical protein n=1 Tax=Burkholderia gladioli TaxID=28095 RepID=UPI001641DA59|nr:hypothetical protein [Burkholderia gladioli]